MLDPMIVIPAATAGMGAWVLLAGRPLLGLPRWPLQGAGLRGAGAYCLLASLFVIALALAGLAGLAFVAYALLTLAFAAFVVMTRKVKPGTQR
jgi:hypothetical protein